ncbi:MmgE/PrpD family protein [Gordonia sp. X0973]|uniref:MmgE/PrpD family protein n=1 Tax=Gordonia sp. X0973 TaxID=2742602 RepID=UPI000F51D04F|nr:MmgE/PrpD family protein [Gordonia sp. X0973]QKT08818.1 MmgE/PrpD family protein [Gordonia sp. X0973]
MTLIDTLAGFAGETSYESLPGPVVTEAKRLILDSLGCAVAAVDHPKGAAGIAYGQTLGGGSVEATIIGTPHRGSALGAGFANGELINALDFDAILPPGHVVPYVLPGALAVAEAERSAGTELIVAVAVAHEMSNRFGKAMDYHREVTEDGQIHTARVLGFSSTIFGATAAVARLRGSGRATTTDALALAPTIAPPNTMRSWFAHTPSTTFKYLMAGALVQSAFCAHDMAALGHRGDHHVLDDADHGYAAFIASGRWEPCAITSDLGTRWGFPAEQAYKPYPHCRVLHGLLDLVTAVADEHNLAPAQIDKIEAWGEAWVEHPIWENRSIDHPVDAQFSIGHGLALGAHRVPPGPQWQRNETVQSESVLALMDRVEFHPHPEWAVQYRKDHSQRPSKVTITARGQQFTAEGRVPKGSPSADPATTMSWDELVDKFAVNCAGRLSGRQVDRTVELVANLENLDHADTLMAEVAART